MIRARWDLRLDRFRSRIGENVKQKAERITQKLIDEFIDRSPVRTGNFRAAWNVSEGSPIFKYVLDGSTLSILPAPKFNVKASTLFPVFFITNGQPYAQKLESGTSTQAPHGVIGETLTGMR
jgi:hypothetical protein